MKIPRAFYSAISYFPQVAAVSVFLLVCDFTLKVQGQSLVGMTLARDQCDLTPQPVMTQPDAQAIIATSLDLSEAGIGNFGCGAPKEGILFSFDIFIIISIFYYVTRSTNVRFQFKD